MNDTLSMRGRDTICDGRPHLHRFLPGHARRRYGLPEVLTIEQLGDGIGDIPLGSEIMDGKDVRVIQLGHRLGLAFEPGETAGVLRH